jgi:hypothetical protein
MAERARRAYLSEAWSNVMSRRLLLALMVLAIAVAMVLAVAPRVRGEAAALRDIDRYVEDGGLTYELTPSATSARQTVSTHTCDQGWLNPDGVIRWAGGYSPGKDVEPRGALTLPTRAYEVSNGFTRRAGDPTTPPAIVGSDYAHEAGLSTGSQVLIGTTAAEVTVVELPQELDYLSRSVLLPGRSALIKTCVVAVDRAAWRSPDDALDATTPTEMVDWARRCLSCDDGEIEHALEVSRRSAGFWPVGPGLALLVAVLYVMLRRREWAVYRLVGCPLLGLSALASAEALFICWISVALGAASIAHLAGADLVTMQGSLWRYGLQALMTVVLVPVVSSLGACTATRTRIVRMLND